MPERIGIAGSGSCMPETVITNAELAKHIQQKDGLWAEEKLGIRERRFMTPLDQNGHPMTRVDELDMAEKAAREAISSAGMEAEEVDGIWLVSCTPSGKALHFSRMAYDLHGRLKLRAEAPVLQMDAGCGGALHAVSAATDLLRGNGRASMLVVASNAPSQYYNNWEAYVASNSWLSMYIFGDGAGALLLRKQKNLGSTSEIIASYLAVDPSAPLMDYVQKGNNPTPVYDIDARGVALGFRKYARLALEGLKAKHPYDMNDIVRFYFHQVNGKVLGKFVDELHIPRDRVAMHVERYGNIAAAATLVLFDEDRKAGLVSEGDLCLFCTVGAGAQYGAMLVRV